jgi:hypothetical protein
MKLTNKIIQLLPIVLIFLGCTKDNITPNQPHTVDGIYIGNTYQINKWANPTEGYQEQDSLFTDTFFVSFVDSDTIVFKNKGVNWNFLSNTNNYYIEWYGTNSNREFEIHAIDSLTVKYWSYGGFGNNFNQINLEFDGKKQ